MRTFLCTAAAAAFIAATPAFAAPVNYSGSQGTVQFNVPTVSSNGLRWTGQQYINPTKVIYDSATGTYTLRDTGSPTKTSTFTGVFKDTREEQVRFVTMVRGGRG